MIDALDRRITPWVGRLLAINAVVLLVQQTVLTSPSLARLLAFDSARMLQHPWTVITYMFVHGGVLHLAANSLALFVFGPAVERRFGSQIFFVYYMLCGVGAALIAAAIHTFGYGNIPTNDPNEIGIVGASGAILGVAYAFARFNPDAQMMVFPVPVPIKAKWLVYFFFAYDVFGLYFLRDGTAHEAHIGGLLTGLAFFIVRGIGRPVETIPLPTIRPRVPVVARSDNGTSTRTLSSRPDVAPSQPAPERQRGVDEAIEIDRVLDKISATGISSLTPEERTFLDKVAQRRRDAN